MGLVSEDCGNGGRVGSTPARLLMSPGAYAVAE